MARARKNVPTWGRLSKIDEESTSENEKWWALELAGVDQVDQGLRRKRVGREGHRVHTAVQGYELDPLPEVDLQLGRDHMLNVAAARKPNDLSNGGDVRV